MNPKIVDFYALQFYVGNSKTAASYFVTRFGFEHFATRTLETGWKYDAEHAVRCGDIIFVFTSSYSENEEKGDYVETIVLETDVTKAGTHPAYGDVTFEYVSSEEKANDNFFSPAFKWKRLGNDPINNILPPTLLTRIDHVVGNQHVGEMESVCARLEKTLDMHRYWSVDEKQIHTQWSSLRSIVMASENEKVLLPINEPATGLKKSQIQEFLDYNKGPGVQHIALNTNDIIASVSALRERGVNFLYIPDSYYESLERRLRQGNIVIKEPLEILKKLNILVDFDDNGYLLQIFTESMDYRPTVFFEIIQRHNFNGFGGGNFKELFTSLEAEQEKRGNLVDNPTSSSAT